MLSQLLLDQDDGHRQMMLREAEVDRLLAGGVRGPWPWPAVATWLARWRAAWVWVRAAPSRPERVEV
jgi:hypothetical protein